MNEKYYRVARTISRWKLDNPLENWLGSLADKSELWKRLYVLFYRLFDADYYEKGMPFLEKEIGKQLANEPWLTESVGGDKKRYDIQFTPVWCEL